MSKNRHDSCNIGEVFEVLGKSHVLDLLYVAITREGPVRFGDWQKALKLSPNTLSSRLKLLVD
ncbi:MAG: winged helix-turn-helix transcriptional regulator, partial [Thermoplasmatota archaeon]